jgi:hypothetical protein
MENRRRKTEKSDKKILQQDLSIVSGTKLLIPINSGIDGGILSAQDLCQQPEVHIY